MAIGPQRPFTGSGSTSDPRLDALLTGMPTGEIAYKGADNQMHGSGMVVANLKVPSVLVGTDSNANFKPVPISALAQQVIASNSEQMVRSMLGIEMPTNVSQLSNDSGYITASQIPAQTQQVASDWNSASGVSQILNKPVLFSGSYSDLTGKPLLFDGKYTSLSNVPTTFNPTPHTHTIGDVTGLQFALDSKLNSGASIPYSQITGTPTIPVVNYPVKSVNSKTGDVVLTAADVGAIATGSSIAYSSLTGTPTAITKTSQITNDSGFITSVNYPVASVNGKTGAVVLAASDVGAAATSHTHAITDVTGLQAAIDLKANATSLPNYRRSDNSAVSGPIKVKYYTATSDATSVWTVALGTDFTEVLDVQVTATSIANTVAGVRQASLNAFTSTSTSLSGITTGNTVLTTVLISAGANTLSLIPNTAVRVTVTGK